MNSHTHPVRWKGTDRSHLENQSLLSYIHTYIHIYRVCVCVCVISLSSSTVDGMVNEKEKDMVRMLDTAFILTLQQLA